MRDDGDPLAESYRLIAALQRNTATAMSASLTLQIMTGFSTEDCTTIISWVGHDPRDAKPLNFVDELERSTRHVLDFERALWGTIAQWGRHGKGLGEIPYEPSA